MTVWVPSRAVGLRRCLGTTFPRWSGDFVVGALAERSLRLRGGEVVVQDTMLRALTARIREVRVGPDGCLSLVTDDANGSVLRPRG